MNWEIFTLPSALFGTKLFLEGEGGVTAYMPPNVLYAGGFPNPGSSLEVYSTVLERSHWFVSVCVGTF